MELPETIKINHPTRGVITASTKDYLFAKLCDLQEFGFKDLTESVLRDQLKKIIKNEKLSVIGKFMEDEIVRGNDV